MDAQLPATHTPRVGLRPPSKESSLRSVRSTAQQQPSGVLEGSPVAQTSPGAAADAAATPSPSRARQFFSRPPRAPPDAPPTAEASAAQQAELLTQLRLLHSERHIVLPQPHADEPPHAPSLHAPSPHDHDHPGRALRPSSPRDSHAGGSHCSLEVPGFQAVLEWWESAATVLGVTAGTVTQGDVDERLESASGGGNVRRRRPSRSGAATPLSSSSRALSPVAEQHSGTPPGGYLKRAAQPQQEGDPNGNSAPDAEDRDGGGIPGLDFVYRLYAPRKLLDAYESLEREVASDAFRRFSPEDQGQVLKELHDTQAAIEQRENRLNIIASAVGGLHGAYVGTMASMLCIFVPQQCPPTETSTSAHTCNLYENTHDLTVFNQVALALNAWTLCMMLTTEYAIFRREKWLDTTLSYNPRKAARYLSEPGAAGQSPLQRFPYIAHQLLWQNQAAGNLARATIAMVLVNLLVSSIVILGWYSDGTRSVTSLITNTLLLGGKLLWASVVCLQSKNNQQGVSLYKTTRVNFNVIDANFLNSEEFGRNKDKYTWDDVQGEYARVLAAEKGDVKVMAENAKVVLRHVALGHRSRSLRATKQSNLDAAAAEAVAAAEAAEAAAVVAEEQAAFAAAPEEQRA